MDQKEIAKSLLKSVPGDVFDIWISPFIDLWGWPFASIDDDSTKTKWFQLFGCTISEFSQKKWIFHSFKLPELRISRHSLRAIKRIRDYTNNNSADSQEEPFRGTRQRMEFHCHFIDTNHKLFAPIVLENSYDGLLVLDSSHRLAALFDIGFSDVDIDAWIAVST